MLFLSQMKRYRKIVFEIILFLAVLFCIGINTYSHVCSIEHSSGKNCVENSFMSEIDTFDDDQVIQTNVSISLTKPAILIPVLQYCFFVQPFSLSVWQPPQNS